MFAADGRPRIERKALEATADGLDRTFSIEERFRHTSLARRGFGPPDCSRIGAPHGISPTFLPHSFETPLLQ